MILEKSNWTTPVDFIISDIIEYDMKRAGLSIIKENKMLPDSDIERLQNMEKRTADTEIGKLNYKIKGFSSRLEDYKRQYRLQFGNLNYLTDDDIISVKSDAIFTKKVCDKTQLTDNILFREKNYYQAMMKLDKIEFYWGEDNILDIKGIRDELVELHKDYILKDIWNIMRCMIEYDNINASKKIVKLMDDYKFRRLESGYYREFNSNCKYILSYEDGTFAEVNNVGQSYIKRLNINYNYINVLVPLLNLILS